MPTGDPSPLNPVFGEVYRNSLNRNLGYTPPKENEEQLNRIEEKLDSLHKKLDLIFGGNVLIDGKFVDFKELIKSLQ